MSPEILAVALFGGLLFLLFTGLPVAFCLIGISVVGYLLQGGPGALYGVFSSAYVSIIKDIFIAAPLYVFMSCILVVSGIGKALYDTMFKWMSGLRGGLAMGTVLICTVLAASSGLAATGTIMLGMIGYPEMRKRGYDKSLAIGCILGGGSLGPIIPPSVFMILVGGLTSLSIGKLFMGALIPGLMMSASFILYIGIRGLLNPKLCPGVAKEEQATWNEKLASLRATVLPVLLVVFVLGAIYTGLATPTEAGGVGAGGALVCAAIYRNLTWDRFKQAAITTLKVNAMLMWLVIGGTMFASVTSLGGAARVVEAGVLALPLSPFGTLILMIVVILILGMFMENVAIAMITLPIFMPIAVSLGFDPLWFGIIYSISVLIGIITPPFGYSLFYFKGLGHPDVSLRDVYTASLPFAGLMSFVLALCLVFAQLSLWLPNAMIR
ncbi:MAG: hypothetical protein A3G80_06790 [Betaproteobacteria bacterium RIFCSPLOWO2_12_FULL_62_13b]|nr:MAG: hypothetical protein A3G80_06790 [Betaproteobacteria bacterium RIFCSPLOWO2_12_FULL_62_13b]